MSHRRDRPPSPGRTTAARTADAACDALRFFTRLPVPQSWSAETPQGFFDGVASAAPLAGATVGAGAGLALMAGLALGLSPLAAAVAATAAAVALSGALHLDALADVADGFGGGDTRAKKLAIMRDSRLGTYGGAALALALIGRIALIAALAERLSPGGAALALIAAAALARPLALLPTLLLAPARAEGLGHAARPAARFVVTGCALGAGLALLLAGFPGAAAALAALAAALAVAALAKRQIGGVTGDVCGAAAELAELAALAALVAAAA